MKQYTVRGLSGETERRLAREAKEKGVSLNRAIVSLIEKEAGVGSGKLRAGKHSYKDLDHLFGIWTKDDAGEFGKNLELQRKVDEGLWKIRG